MDPVHDRGSMDPVHESGPWTRSKVGFMDPWSMFCPHPWRTIMGDAVLEDFRGKDCAFVVSWLQGKGLNKLCAVYEVFKF